MCAGTFEIMPVSVVGMKCWFHYTHKLERAFAQLEALS